MSSSLCREWIQGFLIMAGQNGGKQRICVETFALGGNDVNMPLQIGCDLVSIGRFRDRIREGGIGLLERIFLPAEYLGQPVERLAGMFAAKEAVCKALRWPPGRWLEIAIEHEPSGAPRVILLNDTEQGLEMSISISHEENYALAFAVALLR